MLTAQPISKDAEAVVEKFKQLLDAVARQSVQNVVEIALERCPVDTGYLRASVRASFDQPAPYEGKRANRATVSTNSASIFLAIATWDLTSPLYISFVAAYANAVEYGTSRMAPRAFVRSAIQQFPQIVERNFHALKRG